MGAFYRLRELAEASPSRQALQSQAIILAQLAGPILKVRDLEEPVARHLLAHRELVARLVAADLVALVAK